jgi:signal transduction histidine kinase
MASVAPAEPGPVPDRSVTIQPVQPRSSLLDVDVRERLIEAARLATVGRLVASVVHAISTPLAAIALRAESLEHSATDPNRLAPPEKVARYLSAIGQEAGRCKQILTALREFGGALNPRVEPVDVAALCRSAALLVHDEALQRQVEVKVVLDEALPAVRGLRGRLGQAILALLLNALDASPSGACVRVEARAVESDAVEVIVTDEGDGLSEELGGRLFAPFASTRSPVQGLGLGLMACRAVAEAQGGRLEAHAEARGCRFVLRLRAAGQPDDTGTGDARA